MGGTSVKELRRRHEAGEHLPAAAAVRVGRTTTMVLSGADDLSGWDDEELARGRRRNPNGRFTGRAPVVVATELHQELVKKKIKEAERLFRENLVEAVELLGEIVRGQDVEDKDRIKAAGMMIDRIMGKAPERIEITGGPTPMQKAFEAMLVPDESDIIDAEIVEDDEDEDGEDDD